MNLGENLSNSFDYAKKMFSDGGRLIILIVLNLIPIANWIVVGYAARVLKESPSNQVPPKLEQYGELFVDGAKVFFASLIYMIIPMAVMFAGIGSVFTGTRGELIPNLIAGRRSSFFSGTGLLLILVGIILIFLFLLLLGVGVAHLIKTAKFGKAFAFGEILGIVQRVGWGRYLGWILLTGVVAVVIGAIASIPFVGWILSVVVSPILTVFIFRSLGTLYNDGAPAEYQASSGSAPISGVVCTACGTPLQAHHKFCPSCGAPTPPAALPTTTGAAAATKFCISCGARILTPANFCGSCGGKQT